MVIVDTSVWISHLREGNAELGALLNEGEVVCHPFVIGELACGNIGNRVEILSLIRSLPMANEAEHEEVLRFVDEHELMGIGLGYIDVHLIASATLTDASIWTFDKKLHEAASRLNVDFQK